MFVCILFSRFPKEPNCAFCMGFTIMSHCCHNCSIQGAWNVNVWRLLFFKLTGFDDIWLFISSLKTGYTWFGVKICNIFVFSWHVLVVPVLFQHSLKESEDQMIPSLDHIFTVNRIKINGPSTDEEVALALRVLEGCCLLHSESTVLAHQHRAIQVCIHQDLNARPCRNQSFDAMLKTSLPKA